jgi:predicted metal-binding protein
MKTKQLFDILTQGALSLGATNASVITASDIPLDRQFREMCAVNACGVYGKCWMCPPDIGEIDELMAQIKEYDHALVYQTVTPLEDSFDYEGMIAARRGMSVLSQKMRKVFATPDITRALHLSVGGCGVCEECTKKIGEPCRHPDLAMPSLEAYGVNVSEMARVAGMKYINGQNTVTYFGAVLFCTAEGASDE